MKRNIITICLLLLVAAAFLVTDSAQAQTNSSWNVTISPAAGGTKTAFSIFATDSFINGYTAGSTSVLNGLNIAIAGAFAAPPSAFLMPGLTANPGTTVRFSIPGTITWTNLTTAQGIVLNEISFLDLGSGNQRLYLWNPDGNINYTTGDNLRFDFDTTPAEFEIDLAFENFSQGTYNTGPIGVNSNSYNMEIVPEPSTYALLALSAAGLGAHVLRRRRK